MATRPFTEFPADEQQQVLDVCRRVGLAAEMFDITDEVDDAGARRVSVRRVGTDNTSVYEAGAGTAWMEEFESDLECGLYGPVTV
ncbi:hypothetical protein MKD50_02860 [Cupriavidus sp. WGtm5]|uniref:hypothetical protein n=1 Tax=Cupriavidus TaxID=106589 RepID=UPI000E10B6C1|nr:MULTISPECIES: hypothetical protein [Cupriavidus]MCO4888303.1 hypothetical protein [Cupriavidus sp. WGtm5]ULX52665.1 hypothetical protein A9P79_08865 [Cupriavidus taiwanensis]SPA43186.1 conserved hypothetical protein [Cupriavidus taiwanensis]